MRAGHPLGTFRPGHDPVSRAILECVSIGAKLHEARQRAGLTIAEASARTRIRSPIIRAIERDDFSSCGGDFYARGHIRALARAAGLDPGPLVREYDAAHPSGQPPAADELARRPPPGGDNPGRPDRSSPPGHRKRRRQSARAPWSLLAVLVTGLLVISFGSYRLASSGGHGQRLASAGASARPPARPATATPPATRGGQRPSGPASPPARAPSASPGPRPSHKASAVRTVTPVSATAFGPAGTSDGDNPQNALLALSGNSSTPWHTDWYTTARFGNLEQGTGLLLNLGRTVTATSVTIRLGSTPGADLQVRAGTSPGSLSTVASASNAGGTVRLHLASPARARYLLIWFTLLPPDSSGTYQADISGVTVTAS